MCVLRRTGRETYVLVVFTVFLRLVVGAGVLAVSVRGPRGAWAAAVPGPDGRGRWTPSQQGRGARRRRTSEDGRGKKRQEEVNKCKEGQASTHGKQSPRRHFIAADHLHASRPGPLTMP